MEINYRSLRCHLTGRSIPRHIIGDILNVFKSLPDDITEVFATLDRTRAHLEAIADKCPQLTRFQSSSVKRSYLTLMGNSKTLSKQLEGDLEAINRPAIRTQDWMPYWGTFIKGLRGIGKCDHISVAQVEPIYRLLWETISARIPFDPDNSQIHTDAVVKKSTNRLAKELQQYDILPEHIKRLPVWNKVFYGINLPNREVAFNQTKPDNTSGERKDVPLVGYVGHWNAEQEPGFKIRLSASPLLMYQCALEPLQRKLQGIISDFPQDCHRKQDEGSIWAQAQLINNKLVYSFDLSKATHLFPWDVQLKCLQYLGVPKAVLDLYTYVSKGDFENQGQMLTWISGQPLGTNPSFFAFSLAHHALIRGICADLNVDVDCYRVLGDDVVIADQKVALRYQELIGKLGAKINLTKSIVEDSTKAEFAGYTIYKDERFRTGKFRSITPENEWEIYKDFINLDHLKPEVGKIRKSVTDFYNFSPLNGENDLDPEIHEFIVITQANLVAKNLRVPDTLTAWDFATTICNQMGPSHRSAYTALFDYYHRKMEGLSDEILTYLSTDSWVKEMDRSNYRIIFGIRELLRELAMCPTQCCPVWAERLTSNRSANTNFLRVRRSVIEMGTAYRLMRPPAWMVRGDKFASNVHKWTESALKRKAKGTLTGHLSHLKEMEAKQRDKEIAKPISRNPGDNISMVFDY